MTRQAEHDRIERLERKLDEMRAAHAQRVHADCCCHHSCQHITYPYPSFYPWTSARPWYWTSIGNSTSNTIAYSTSTNELT